MSQDRELFSDRMLEGEYTTWNWLWTLDYGAGANLFGITCDNLGTVYVIDKTGPRSHVITRAGVSTTILNYWFLNFGHEPALASWHTIARPYSATGKYMLGWKVNVPVSLSVWRDGVLIYPISYAVILPDALSVARVSISANGRYIAVICSSVATGNYRYVQLYEGR